MSYVFTDRVRQVLAMAREEAIGMRHDYVGTEHLLLGLIREGGGVATAVLTNLSVDAEQVRSRVEQCVHPGKGARATDALPYTSRAKKVLEFAMQEASALDHAYIGTEHLLLGLLREEKGIAAQVLNELGITLEKARRQTLELLGTPDRAPGARHTATPERGIVQKIMDLVSPPSPAPSAAATFAIEIDDGSSVSIYEQIVAQVQEAVATRRLRAGERLPTVRQMADELDIAPGTVARAYSELERLGVVVTEGARGTFVADGSRQPIASEARPETLVGLLRPVAVAAFHLGATAPELREALDAAMRGIYDAPPPAA
jgi:DNA-binding transcriptional regulator YhcF (GntR family)